MTDTPYRSEGPVRPNALLVVAIVGIVFSSFGLISNAATTVQAILLARGVGVGSPEMARAAARTPGWVIGFYITQGAAGFAVWMLWLVTCVALLRSVSWARRLGLTVAMIHLTYLVVFTVASAVVVNATKDVTLEQVRAQRAAAPTTAPGNMQPMTETFALVVMFGGLGCGFVFGAVLPVWMSIVLRRRDVIEYFEGSAMEPPDYFPPPAPPQ